MAKQHQGNKDKTLPTDMVNVSTRLRDCSPQKRVTYVTLVLWYPSPTPFPPERD